MMSRPHRYRRITNARATVVFVHHFGGNSKTTTRHQRLMLGLGFDTYAFDLSFNEAPEWNGLWPRHLHLLNPINTWVNELEAVLNEISGPKILYSFSFPSVSCALLLGTRTRADVLGWICDGGPFLDMLPCQWNLFTHAYPAPFVRRLGLTVGSWATMGGPLYGRRIAKALAHVDPKFPILSVRAGQDVLVPPPAIAHFFDQNSRLKPEVFELPEAGHLEGLKNFSGVYTARVTTFCDRLLHYGPT